MANSRGMQRAPTLIPFQRPRDFCCTRGHSLNNSRARRSTGEEAKPIEIEVTTHSLHSGSRRLFHEINRKLRVSGPGLVQEEDGAGASELTSEASQSNTATRKRTLPVSWNTSFTTEAVCRTEGNIQPVVEGNVRPPELSPANSKKTK